MQSATHRGEPLFVLPDGRVAPWPTGGSLPEKNKPARNLESTGRVGLIDTSLGQDTTTEMTQVAPLIAGNGSPSGAIISGGPSRGVATASLGGQARPARPALGECERYDCGAPASTVKTLYCGHQGMYCDEHVGSAW